MSGWNRGHSSYNQNANRLRDKLAGRSQADDDATNQNKNTRKPPPGLRGREIGLWYRDNQIRKRDAEQRLLLGPNVSLSEDRIKKIREAIKNSKINQSMANTGNFQNDFDYHNRKDFMELLKTSASSVSDWDHSELNEELLREFIDKANCEAFLKMQESRENLPAHQHKEEILEAIKKHQVVLIEGNTGCGKTTQVVQYILDDALINLNACKTRIICTQPRRIAATSIAERVASERAEELGKSIGYQIRLEKIPPRSAGSILFCTTGVLMKFMESDPILNSYSHIIIDEIHERNVTTDICLSLIKKVVENRKSLKVILMSATLNAESFSKYFNNCPMVHIEGFTFPVEEHFLEDVLEETGFDGFQEQRQAPKWIQHKFKKQRQDSTNEFDLVVGNYARSLKEPYSRSTIENLLNPETEKINVEFIDYLIHYICFNKAPGAILIILPGFSVISKLLENLQKSPQLPSSKFVIYPLHSLLTGSDQRSIFNRPPEGVRKIILSTPLAETSITIDDVVYVINAGKMRKPYFDFERNATVLEDQWITKANETQRKGRAGRVQPGICYHLYSRARSNALDPFEEPEILKIRLEEVLLTVKVLCIKDVKMFMSTLIDVPEERVIDASIELLRRLGALTENDDLTPLGLHLARLAVPPRIGKMLLLGSILGCFDPIASIAAALSFKSPFYTIMGNEDKANEAKREFSRDSDQLAVSNAMKEWKVRGNGQRGFCYANFLSHTTMLMLDRFKSQFAQSLYNTKFLPNPRCDNDENNKHTDNEDVLRAVICGGLYPNIAYQSTKITKRFTRRLIRTVDKKRLSLLPSSVNDDRQRVCSPGFMMYHELNKFTSGFFLLETTANISPYAILMFGDQIKTEISDNTHFISVGEIAVFKCNRETAQLIIELREGFNGLLAKKIKNPQPIDWKSDEGMLIQAILDLISIGSNTFQDYKQIDDDDDNDVEFK